MRQKENRWTEYFEGLLNMNEEREAEIVAVGRKGVINVLGEVN